MVNISKYIVKPKTFVLWIVIFIFMVWICTYYSLSVLKDFTIEHSSLYISEINTSSDAYNGYLIKTPKCWIPNMYLNGSNVDKFMDYSTNINCKKDWDYNLPLIMYNTTALILNLTAWATLNIFVDDPLFKCYYTPLERAKFDENNRFIDNEVRYGQKVYFKESVIVADEMVEVICTLNNVKVYWDYHLFIHPTPGVLHRKDGNVSVLVLGLDSVARLNFHRQMPKTSEFLSKLGNVEMMGYNKIEDNTYPNLIAVLTGFSAGELVDQCRPHDDSLFDDCRFVWDSYKEAKFDTVLMEDSPLIGIFNFLKKGFGNKPTDHYLRPLMLDAEKNIGHQLHANVIACTGPRLAFTALLRHVHQIIAALADRLYMSFVWSTSLTHDYAEYPRFGDDDLRDFLDAFNRSGRLDNTALVLMSDHGMRWGPFRDTYQGGLEERLPMLRFILPARFQQAYPAAMRNLRRNTAMLTTPYDLHETLLDLLDPGRLISDHAIEARARGAPEYRATSSRASSLFLEVSENRSCQDVGIPQHYCTCHDNRTALPVDDADVASAATELLRYLNDRLSAYPLCSVLSLHTIHSAAVETRSNVDSPMKDYELQVSTVPGYAKFEATVRKEGGRFWMMGSVSRLNLYGTQSACVSDTIIKLMCFCAH